VAHHLFESTSHLTEQKQLACPAPTAASSKGLNLLVLNWLGPLWMPILGHMACRFTLVKERDPTVVKEGQAAAVNNKYLVTLFAINASYLMLQG
jgi:hypothetical protein